MIFVRIFILVLPLFYIRPLVSQTCCSGGVPVSNNIGMPSTEVHQLQLGFVYDNNTLDRINSGRETLDDRLRSRQTHSYIFRSSYSFDKKWSLELFVPFINQTRTITNPNSQNDFEESWGIGDIIILPQYKIIDKLITWRAGIGLKLPTGSFDERNARGLFLLEDLQPGSGSYDWLLFSSFNLPIKNPSNQLSINTIYSNKGINNESRAGLQSYQFGSEIQIITNFSKQALIFKQLIDWSIGLRYRYVERDKVDSIPLPATGGDFVFSRLNLSIPIKSNASLGFQFESPLFIDVNDTQVRPRYSFNVSFIYTLNLKKRNHD